LFRRRFIGYGFPALRNNRSDLIAIFGRMVLADFFHRPVLDFMGVTGSAVEILVDRVFLAASRGFEMCTLRMKLIFSLDLKHEQFEKRGLLMLTRKPTICSLVPNHEKGKHGSSPRDRTYHFDKYLPRPLLLTCCSLCHCSLSTPRPFLGLVAGYQPSVLHNVVLIQLSPENLPLNRVLRVSTSPAATELQATRSRPTHPW